MNGARRFDRYDPVNGILRASFLDEEGNAEFQSQELLNIINQMAGRIVGLDLRPKVLRAENSLSALKDSAVAQVILDSVIPENNFESVVRNFAFNFVTLGSCGLTGHMVDHPTIGLTTDLEVVHPREIFAFPALGQDITKQRGILRQRQVPMSFLADVFGERIKRNKESLSYYTCDPGRAFQHFDYETELGIHYMPEASNQFGGDAGDGRDELTDMVTVRELWLDGPAGTCGRYIIASGEYIIDDQDFAGKEMYCPLAFGRFFDTGMFHGGGMFDLMFSLHRELERLLKSLFNNIRDIDRYGVVVMPHGAFNDRAVLREVGKGLRAYFYSPDPSMAENANYRPFVIQPFNSGDVPGKVASFAKQLMTDMNPIQNLLKEKGRVDSFSGLQFLDEQINRAMDNPINGVEQVFGQLYRSMASQSTKYLLASPRALPVTRLTLDLAGAVIDPETMDVSFHKNPLPVLSHLKFTVREVNPRSEAAMKQEGLELVQRQISDPQAFKIFCMQNGINLATWMDDDYAAFQSVNRDILLLYGDGTEPGRLVITPHRAKPDLQLRILQGFMASPAMSMASVEVQDEFKRYRETLMQYLGLSLPEAVPNPDDAAMLGAQMQQMAQAQPQQPQQPQLPQQVHLHSHSGAR